MIYTPEIPTAHLNIQYVQEVLHIFIKRIGHPVDYKSVSQT